MKDVKIPGCDVFCPFNDFMVLMKNLIATDVELMCSEES